MDLYDILFAMKHGHCGDYYTDLFAANTAGEWKTVSGPIAHITDAKASKVKSLKAQIEPVQDLHGYDSPWPAGGGKNLFDIDNPFITAVTAAYITTYAPKVEDGKFYNGGKIGESAGASYAIPVKAGSTYTVQFVIDGESANWEIRAITLDGNVWTSNTVLATNRSDPLTGAVTATVTIPSGYTHLYVACYSATKQGSWETNIQIEKGSTATSWTPYSNECPITGHTGVTVEKRGKNILNPSLYKFQTISQNGLTYTVNSDWSISVTGTVTATGGPSLTNYFYLPAGTYSYLDEGNQQDVHCAYRKIPNGQSSSTSLDNPFTTDGTDRIYVNIYSKVSSGSIDLTIHPQIEAGSTSHDYEPYQGESVTISLGDTIYGATLDVVSGKLMVDRAMVDLGTLSGASGWQYITNDGDPYFRVYLDNKKPGLGMLCSDYQVNSTTGTSNLLDKRIGASVADSRVYVRDNAYTTLESFLTAMNGVQLVYELAEPIEYTLTPQEVRTFLGQNNIWNDVGDTEVTYRAKKS